jgi:formylglycine-generating enzyme required for sulfatase activity
MVVIPGGTFVMGSDRHYPEEAPAHEVTVDGFSIDRFPVTNDQFAEFVRATRYRTIAEREQDPAVYPDAPAHLLRPSSVVFVPPLRPVSLHDHLQWWRLVPGANWRHPSGPGSSIRRLGHHPVVHVAWADVEAYAAWAGKALPTEAEWEYAARGGLHRAEYAWGEELTPNGRHLANTWQGDFPVTNTEVDGYARTSPVDAFPPNGYGLHDMIGNVWEWTADTYGSHQRRQAADACCAPGPSQSTPAKQVAQKVMKGGSHLCAPNYCRRYRPAARMAQAVDTGTSHLGFRCVMRH